ncbi:hypothetical protein N0V93_002852 [Gnomoniopsis smithogilvyi]|uniref:Uncharacterized protein n=1 Tax=Gnomoniopsis smithogilvyi TaxID=1191159 RepID=A0A9W8YXG2_9PEZI|nr:hypothetical protein N0V93_002852 [Gnomoniopsis smithogilvyi]
MRILSPATPNRWIQRVDAVEKKKKTGDLIRGWWLSQMSIVIINRFFCADPSSNPSSDRQAYQQQVREYVSIRHMEQIVVPQVLYLQSVTAPGASCQIYHHAEAGNNRFLTVDAALNSIFTSKKANTATTHDEEENEAE